MERRGTRSESIDRRAESPDRESATSEQKTQTAYCPNCERERELRVTVPWQPDLCSHCSTDIEPE